jgi:hypothetical protein
MLKKSANGLFPIYERATKGKNHIFSGPFHPMAVDMLLKNTFQQHVKERGTK